MKPIVKWPEGFQHNYQSESCRWTMRTTYCCGLMEMHGIQMHSPYDAVGLPEFTDWEHHILAHVLYHERWKHHFGQIMFTFVTSTREQECANCDADGYIYDEEEDRDVECYECDGTGVLEDEPVVLDDIDVWEQFLRDQGFTDFHRGPEFKNPNTGNKCQTLLWSIDDPKQRRLFNATRESCDYTGTTGWTFTTSTAA